jgi:plastocyanin
MREPKRWVWSGAVVTLVAAALLLSACSGGGNSGTAGASASPVATNSLTISNFMFTPMVVAVAPGSTVRVTNKDSVTHTLTASGGQFNAGDIGPGRTKTFTAPTKAGMYGYICNIHQYMMGSIVER